MSRIKARRATVPEATNHRAAILSGIRRSLGASATPSAIAAEYAAIARTYTKASGSDAHAIVELFADRLREYDAGVYHASEELVPGTVAEILALRGKRSLVIPASLPEKWLPKGVAFEEADLLDAYQLDRTEGVLSGCTVAIAETGSIVLQNAPAQGPRILSLVPDYHLCVVFVAQIVATVPEAFVRLEATSSLPTTFISGPSATADIEMTRIKGVHGPRFLDVLIVNESRS
jgi:L-lactate dehydrogenase complex protein LldG